MNRILIWLRNNNHIRKVLRIVVILSFFIYFLSVPLFEHKFRIAPYFTLGFLGFVSFTYCFLYKTLKVNRLFFFPLMFAFYGLIGTIIYSKEFRSWLTVVLLCSSIIIFYYTYVAIDNKAIFFYSILSAATIFALFFIIESLPEISQIKDFTYVRLGEQYGNQNSVSGYLTFGITFSIFCCLLPKRRVIHYLLSALSFILCFVCGALTGSRSFLLLAALNVLILLCIKLHNRPFILIVGFSATFIAVVSFLCLPFAAGIRNRLLSSFSGLDISSITRGLWREYGFALGADNFIFGYGADGFNKFSGTFTYSHSNFSEVFCNFGLIGFILFYSPYLYVLFKAIKNKNCDSTILLLFLINSVIKSLTTVYYIRKLDMVEISLMLFIVTNNFKFDFLQINKAVPNTASVYDTLSI